MLSWFFFFFFLMPPAPSDISPPVASPSLVEPVRCDGLPTIRGVELRLPVSEAVLGPVLAFFFRVDSVPLESETPGEPARFKDLPFFPDSTTAFLPCPVSLPLEAPDLSFSFSLSLSLPSLSSSFLASSSSLSESESLCSNV